MLKGFRTVLVAAALVVLGGLETFNVTDYVTTENAGIALAAVGLLVAVLRKFTTTPLGQAE